MKDVSISTEIRTLLPLPTKTWGRGNVIFFKLVIQYRVFIVSDDKMINECGAIGGMSTGKRNRNAQSISTTVPLRPPQIPLYLTWDL
jgi:hypothetical protein